MSEFFEAIKTLGSIVGLATGIFVIFDRMFKGRPTAYIKLRGNDPNDLIDICIKNNAKVDILIYSIECDSTAAHIAKDATTESIIHGVCRDMFSITISADTEICFPIIKQDSWKQLSDKQGITFKINWALSGNTWTFEHPISLKKRVGFLRKLGSTNRRNSLTR